MASSPPNLVLTVVIRPDSSSDAVADAGRETVPVHLMLFVKHHHGDGGGTVDTYELGDLSPRPLRMGSLDDIVEQLREILAGDAAEVARSVQLHTALADVSAKDITELPLEVDLDALLAGRVGQQYDIDDIHRMGDERREGSDG